MNRILKILSAAVLSLSLLTGMTACANSGSKVDANAQADGKLNVYTSFYPMYDFAKKVGGDMITLTNLVPAGTEPHDWEPTAADITALESADVFLYNGAGMEHWVDKVLGSISKEGLVVVEASKGISMLEGHAEEGEEAMPFDPHVWLDPKYAKVEMENIKNALTKADPANKDAYEQNFTSAAAELDKLDKEFTDTLSPLPNKDIIVAHQAFGYLCASYGLNQVAIEGLSADSEPDPAKMSDIITFAKEQKIKVIFFEELVSPKVAETIADAIGAKTDVLNPLEGLTDEQLAAGEDYCSIMRENLAVLKSSLE